MHDSSTTAAECLFYHVICDLAGFPLIIGSDRGLAFVEGAVKDLLNVFGVEQVLGSAYHPQAQSAVERPHREYNALCKTFMESTQDWDRMCYIFAWTIRTTPREALGHFSPYELITGLKPRSPLEHFATPGAVHKVPKHEYVSQLVEYLKYVHKHVDERSAAARDARERAKLREHGVGEHLKEGEYCLVQKPPEKNLSMRFQQKHFDDVYQVVGVHGTDSEAKAYTVCNSQGQRDNLGFVQPVAAERLTSVDILPMSAPGDDVNTRISLHRNGIGKEGTIVSQRLDGTVYIVFDDNPDVEVPVDLTKSKYYWI